MVVKRVHCIKLSVPCDTLKPLPMPPSNQATTLIEENVRIIQVVGIDRLEKCMEKFNRFGFLAGMDRKLALTGVE